MKSEISKSKPLNRHWWEKTFLNCAFYCGFFTKGDIRLGGTLGNKESHIDLLFFTFGFMR
jgi:hypothetical protein